MYGALRYILATRAWQNVGLAPRNEKCDTWHAVSCRRLIRLGFGAFSLGLKKAVVVGK